MNIFRIAADESQVRFEVCDEPGMMMYAGRYGAPPGAKEGKRIAPKDYAPCIAGYKVAFGPGDICLYPSEGWTL